MSDIDSRFDELEEGFRGTSRGPLAKADEFIRLAMQLLSEGIDKATVRSAVERNWNRLVVPYNIPWIPEFLERRIEMRALNTILDAIDDATKGD